MTDRKHLEDSLNRLRSEIRTLDVGDDKTRERLDKLIEDIEKTLANPQHAGTHEPIGERLKASALDFEVSHPRLTALVNEVVDKLSSMGI